MTTLPDLLYVALFAVALPLWDYLVSWPAFNRRSQADPAQARTSLYTWGIASQWALVAVGVVLWVPNDRSWTSFGFSVPAGWRCGHLRLVLLLAAYYAYAVAAVPQLRGTSESAATGRRIHRCPAAHADRTVSVGWGVADRGVLRGVPLSRLPCVGVLAVARAGGAPRHCPFHSSRSGICTRDGMASSARESSPRSTRWSWQSSARSGQQSRYTVYRSRLWDDGVAGASARARHEATPWKSERSPEPQSVSRG